MLIETRRGPAYLDLVELKPWGMRCLWLLLAGPWLVGSWLDAQGFLAEAAQAPRGQRVLGLLTLWLWLTPGLFSLLMAVGASANPLGQRLHAWAARLLARLPFARSRTFRLTREPDGAGRLEVWGARPGEHASPAGTPVSLAAVEVHGQPRHHVSLQTTAGTFTLGDLLGYIAARRLAEDLAKLLERPLEDRCVGKRRALAHLDIPLRRRRLPEPGPCPERLRRRLERVVRPDLVLLRFHPPALMLLAGLLVGAFLLAWGLLPALGLEEGPTLQPVGLPAASPFAVLGTLLFSIPGLLGSWIVVGVCAGLVIGNVLRIEPERVSYGSRWFPLAQAVPTAQVEDVVPDSADERESTLWLVTDERGLLFNVPFPLEPAERDWLVAYLRHAIATVGRA